MEDLDLIYPLVIARNNEIVTWQSRQSRNFASLDSRAVARNDERKFFQKIPKFR